MTDQTFWGSVGACLLAFVLGVLVLDRIVARKARRDLMQVAKEAGFADLFKVECDRQPAQQSKMAAISDAYKKAKADHQRRMTAENGASAGLPVRNQAPADKGKEAAAASAESDRVRDQARAILIRFFGLQRVALGAHGLAPLLQHEGWNLMRHSLLVRTLGDGCHNLADVMLSGSPEGFRHECQWLYEQAEHLQYPAGWQRDKTAYHLWCEFWDLIAAALDVAPRYGIAYEKIESDEDVY